MAVLIGLGCNKGRREGGRKKKVFWMKKKWTGAGEQEKERVAERYKKRSGEEKRGVCVCVLKCTVNLSENFDPCN